MAKLVIKQERTSPKRAAFPYAVVLLGFLVVTALVSFAWNYQPISKNPAIAAKVMIPNPLQQLIIPAKQSAYVSQYAQLQQLAARVNALQSEAESQQLNQRALAEINAILAHLRAMDDWIFMQAFDLEKEQKILAYHQYQTDYWLSRLEFQELRLSRLSPVPEPTKQFQFAKPPEGMKLPAGFCTLGGEGSCSPEPESLEHVPTVVDEGDGSASTG